MKVVNKAKFTFLHLLSISKLKNCFTSKCFTVKYSFLVNCSFPKVSEGAVYPLINSVSTKIPYLSLLLGYWNYPTPIANPVSSFESKKYEFFSVQK